MRRDGTMQRLLMAVLLLLLSGSASAQAAVDGRLLGLDEAQLVQQFPAARHLPKSVPGPRGVRGVWRIESTVVADLFVQTTFFIKNREVARIEQQGTAPQPDCQRAPFERSLLAGLQARYGAGLTSRDNDQGDDAANSVMWVAQGVDVQLRVSHTPSQCSLLLIYEPHIEKDASAL